MPKMGVRMARTVQRLHTALYSMLGLIAAPSGSECTGAPAPRPRIPGAAHSHCQAGRDVNAAPCNGMKGPSDADSGSRKPSWPVSTSLRSAGLPEALPELSSLHLTALPNCSPRSPGTLLQVSFPFPHQLLKGPGQTRSSIVFNS